MGADRTWSGPFRDRRDHLGTISKWKAHFSPSIEPYVGALPVDLRIGTYFVKFKKIIKCKNITYNYLLINIKFFYHIF